MSDYTEQLKIENKMNGSFPYTSSCVGSLGEYSIYEYLNQISSNTSNYTTIIYLKVVAEIVNNYCIDIDIIIYNII